MEIELNFTDIFQLPDITFDVGSMGSSSYSQSSWPWSSWRLRISLLDHPGLRKKKVHLEKIGV